MTTIEIVAQLTQRFPEPAALLVTI